MGLIKAAVDSVSTLMADQWREYFYCDSLPNDVFMKKGQKRVTEGRNSNKGVDNIITNGSVIAVNEGQCMIIVDQGSVVEVCAEAGEFVYDSSSEPSIFYGNLGTSIVDSFKTIGKRFTFGGSTAKDQRVYFFNMKEIMDNLYGTATPIDFHLISPRTGLELETVVKCRGEYSFKIIDPILFYTNVCANVTNEYSKTGEGEKLMSLMKSEILTKLPIALSKIAAQGVLPYQLQAHAEEICQYMREELTESWAMKRGIEVVTMTIVATVPDEDREKINKWNERVLLMNPNMMEARKGEALANFVENSALGGGDGKGSGGGTMDSMMNMMAMNMMSNMMGNGGINPNMAQNATPQNIAPQQMNPTPMVNPAAANAAGAGLGWNCSCGHADNRGKYCTECGAAKPENVGWTCSCGSMNQGKFCTNCGLKKPSGAPLYKCDKCGYEPADPANPPKHCPECGDVFDENDIINK